MFPEFNTNVDFQFYFMYRKNQFTKNQIFAKKSILIKSFIKKYELVKKLFNRVILSKREVFGEYFVNKSETKKNGRETSCSLRCHKSLPAT